jgi:hypothetical protein
MSVGKRPEGAGGVKTLGPASSHTGRLPGTNESCLQNPRRGPIAAFRFSGAARAGNYLRLSCIPDSRTFVAQDWDDARREYRQHAANCLEAAKFASREDVRKVLVSMAQRWNEAAARWERNAALFKDLPAASGPKAD